MKWSNNGRTITWQLHYDYSGAHSTLRSKSAKNVKLQRSSQVKVNFVVTKLISDYLLENKIAGWLCDRAQ